MQVKVRGGKRRKQLLEDSSDDECTNVTTEVVADFLY
jgi:hypothetical protein